MSQRAPRGHWRHRFATEEVYNWTVNKWNTINQRTVNGKYVRESASSINPQHQSYLKKGIKIEISKEDFFDYCSDNEKKILEMMVNGQRPSIDRIDIEKDYTWENIQIIPLLVNLRKDRTGDGASRSSVGSPLKRLGNRKIYLATHPETRDLRFSDKLLEVANPHVIVNAVGIWDARLDEPYDEASPHYGYYLEVLGAVLEALEAQKALVDLQAKLKASRALIEAQKAKDLESLVTYQTAKAWAKSCPEYASVYLANNKLAMRGLLGTTAQRQTILDLQEMYRQRDSNLLP
jgi:hypothetical protein